MLLYADEDFSLRAVEELRRLGHDVVAARDDGMLGRPDEAILARATALGRVVLTHNRDDYNRLHRSGAVHTGILSTSHNRDYIALASLVHAALAGKEPGHWNLLVNKPSRPPSGGAAAPT